jgi:hypothetical protein
VSFDAWVALAVLAILFGTLGGLIWWARSAPPHDDGMGGDFITYVKEPPDPRVLPGERAPGHLPAAQRGETEARRE